MDPLVHTRDQRTVETVDFTRRTWSEEGEDCPISRKGDGHRFMRFTRCDYLEKGKTVTGLYYAELFVRFAAIVQKIRPHLAKKNVLFHHDNAPAHTSDLAKAKVVELGYELQPHPPYSPDLAKSVYNSILVFGSEIAQRNQRALKFCVPPYNPLFSYNGDRQKLV